MLGEILVILAQLGLAAAVLMQKKVLETVNPIHMAAIIGIAFGIASLPILVYLAKTSGLALPQAQLKLTLMASAVSGIAFIVMMEGVKRVAASNAVVISTSAFMLFGIILSALYFGEMGRIASLRFVAGALLITAGVFVLGKIA